MTVTCTKIRLRISYGADPAEGGGYTDPPPATAAPGSTISFQLYAKNGYHVADVPVTITEDGGTTLAYTNAGDNRYSVTLGNKDVTITAHFEKNRHNVTVSSTGDGVGYVNNSSTGLTGVEYGTSVSVTGTGNNGYRMRSYSLTGDSIVLSQNADGFTMGDTDVSVNVLFERYYNVTYIVESGEGSCYLSATGGFSDDVISFNPQPAEGYELEYTPEIIGAAEYSANVLKIGTSDVEIHLRFRLKTYKGTAIYNEDQGIVAVGPASGTYSGGTIIFEITPYTNYDVDQITIEGTTEYSISDDRRTVTCTAQESDITITVTFKEI